MLLIIASRLLFLLCIGEGDDVCSGVMPTDVGSVAVTVTIQICIYIYVYMYVILLEIRVYQGGAVEQSIT